MLEEQDKVKQSYPEEDRILAHKVARRIPQEELEKISGADQTNYHFTNCVDKDGNKTKVRCD